MKVNHFGIGTSDMERSVDFYTKLLGFTQDEVVDLLGKKYVFLTDGNMRIEIEPCAKEQYPLRKKGEYDPTHLALTVEDIDGLAENLKSNGVKFILEPIQLRPDRKISFIEDPDGFRIQLIQYLE